MWESLGVRSLNESDELSSPFSIEMSLPLCAALSQLVISFKAAIWLRITTSGFVMSTSTSGLDTWLASPFPMTTDSYLCRARFSIRSTCWITLRCCIQIQTLWMRCVSCLLFAVPFQHSSPGAILSPAHTVSGSVDQNFFACFSFFFTSPVYIEETGKDESGTATWS